MYTVYVIQKDITKARCDMDQDDDSRRAQEEEIEIKRKKLNEEIERNDFNLSAPSVMESSMELDQYIVEHYHKP